MIDFVRLELKNVKALFDNVSIDWVDSKNRITGQIDKTIGKLLNFSIQILSPDLAYISGSLHTFLHGVNHTDFNLYDLLQAVDLLSSTLGVEPHELRVLKLEFGVNILTSCKVKKILDAYIIHKSEPFLPMKKQNGVCLGVCCQHSQFSIKAYDKALHYSLPVNLLRFEVKVEKNQYLQKKCAQPVKTLADLRNTARLHEFGDLLLSTYDDIVKIHEVDLSAMNKREREVHNFGCFYQNWQGLKTKNPNTYKTKLKRFKDIQQRYKKNNLHDDIRDLLRQKWDELLHSFAAKLHPNLPPSNHIKEKSNSTLIYPLYKYGNSGVVAPTTTPTNEQIRAQLKSVDWAALTEVEKSRFAQRKCIICECDLSHKKDSAKTCSRSCRCRKYNSYLHSLHFVLKALKRNQGFLFPLAESFALSLEKKVESRNKKRETPPPKPPNKTPSPDRQKFLFVDDEMISLIVCMQSATLDNTRKR